MPFQNDRMEGKKRILLIFQENIFKKATDYNIDFLTTGNSFTPLAEKYSNSFSHLLRIFFRLLTRQYDVIFLPTPNVDFEWDKSATKRRIRRLLKDLLKSRIFRFLVKRIVAGKKVIVIDRFYFSSVQFDFWNLFGPDSDYYTTNLSVEAHAKFNNKVAFPEVGYVHQLPLYIDTAKYPVSNTHKKDIDIFFSGSINSPSREKAQAALLQLKSKGYNVIVNTDRLNMQQYFDYMERSLLCLSPAGLGYDCFRHYEIMLAGSVPLINAPDHPLMIELYDGNNCYIYKDAEELFSKSAALLSERQALIEMGRELKENVPVTNDMHSIGRALLTRYVEAFRGARTDSAFKGMLKNSKREKIPQQI